MMPMTGLPPQSAASYPNWRSRERWPNERRSLTPSQRWLRRSSGRLRFIAAIRGVALRLFQRHAAFLDHLGPFVGFRGDELSEVGRTASDQHAAELGEASLDLRVGQPGVDLLVELVDDLGRGALRHAHPVKGAR